MAEHEAMRTVVLLRGLIREARHWGDFAAQLQQALARPVVAPDLAGNGQRWRASSPLTISAMVEDLRTQLGAAPHPYLLVALSLGGMVALSWAQRYPQEVAGLVIINSSARPLSPLWQRLRPGSWPALLAQGLHPAAHREQGIWQLTSNRSPDPAVIACWQHWANECPVSVGNGVRQLWAASRYRVLEGPRQPMLVLTSRGDRLVDWRCSNALASRCGAALQVHPDAGHDLPLDDGRWCVGHIADWWQLSQPCPAV